MRIGFSAEYNFVFFFWNFNPFIKFSRGFLFTPCMSFSHCLSDTDHNLCCQSIPKDSLLRFNFFGFARLKLIKIKKKWRRPRITVERWHIRWFFPCTERCCHWNVVQRSFLHLCWICNRDQDFIQLIQPYDLRMLRWWVAITYLKIETNKKKTRIIRHSISRHVYKCFEGRKSFD